MRQRPFKAMDIGCAQSEFSFSFFYKKPAREFRLKVFYNPCCSIRRTIINDKDMVIPGKLKNGVQNIADILFLIKGWYNYKFFQQLYRVKTEFTIIRGQALLKIVHR